MTRIVWRNNLVKTVGGFGLLPTVLAGVASVSGCGESTPPAAAIHAVKGKVVFKDATALKDLKITFLPKTPGGRSATGDIKPDGSFDLKTGAVDGISEGEYGVRLGRPFTAKGKMALSPISSQYFDEDGSFLSATIKSDTTELPPFDLKPLAKAGADAGSSRRNARDND